MHVCGTAGSFARLGETQQALSQRQAPPSLSLHGSVTAERSNA